MRASEAGVEYNPETAQDLRPRDFVFECAGHAFKYTLQIPEYILRRLTSDVMDKLYDYMEGYASRLITDAIRGGWFFSESGSARVREDVGLHLKNYIWERFSIALEKEGSNSGEAVTFATAPSLQRVLKV